MIRMIVALTSVPFFNKHELDIVAQRTGEVIHACNTFEEAGPLLPDADILIVLGWLGKDVLISCRRLRWVFSLSAGVEKLPLAELAAAGVTVTNARGIHGPQIAEQTMGVIIAFSRQLSRCLRNQQHKKWEQLLPVDELTGKTLCIVGAGSIGQEIARKAKAFDMRVIGVKRRPSALPHFDEVWPGDELPAALRQADYTVLITPLTDETYHLIGSTEFQVMKPGSIFINVSRGDTVDEAALIAALQNGSIAGAGLDVFHEEPLPPDSPLWEMENVLITPHNAGLSPHYADRIIDLFAASLACYREGMPLPNQIDPGRKY
jgi:phosphoglycerate dehydrogenase-like enzyme